MPQTYTINHLEQLKLLAKFKMYNSIERILVDDKEVALPKEMMCINLHHFFESQHIDYTKSTVKIITPSQGYSSCKDALLTNSDVHLKRDSLHACLASQRDEIANYVGIVDFNRKQPLEETSFARQDLPPLLKEEALAIISHLPRTGLGHLPKSKVILFSTFNAMFVFGYGENSFICELNPNFEFNLYTGFWFNGEWISSPYERTMLGELDELFQVWKYNGCTTDIFDKKEVSQLAHGPHSGRLRNVLSILRFQNFHRKEQVDLPALCKKAYPAATDEAINRYLPILDPVADCEYQVKRLASILGKEHACVAEFRRLNQTYFDAKQTLSFEQWGQGVRKLLNNSSDALRKDATFLEKHLILRSIIGWLASMVTCCASQETKNKVYQTFFAKTHLQEQKDKLDPIALFRMGREC